MKAFIVVGILVAALAAAIYLVWENRASDKILGAVVPIVIAAAAAIFLFVGGQPPLRMIFPASFQYQLKSKMPANLPLALTNRRFSTPMYAPAALYKNHPEVFEDATDPEGVLLYHHLLQLAIVEWLSQHYYGNWQSETMTFELPTARETRSGPPQGPVKPSKILSATELKELMKGNIFAESHVGISLQMALPLDTDVTIKPPKSGDEISEIGFRNRFCTLSIRTEFGSYTAGIGVLRSLAGLTDKQNLEIGTSTYLVRVTATFSQIRNGHPDMPLYIAWANGIAQGLKAQFDEQQIFERIKADYVFSKQLEHFGAAEGPRLSYGKAERQ